MHIVDHIHERHICKTLCKITILPAFLLEWFLKSYISMISKDVATTMPRMEDKFILKSQIFYLIYVNQGICSHSFPMPLSIFIWIKLPRVYHTLVMGSLGLSLINGTFLICMLHFHTSWHIRTHH